MTSYYTLERHGQQKKPLTKKLYRLYIRWLLCIALSFLYPAERFTFVPHIMKHMKNRYFVGIFIAALAFVIVLTYDTSLPAPSEGKIIIPHTPTLKRSLTGGSFVQKSIPQTVSGSKVKDTSVCLAENDESCFLITVWSGDYASYFTLYRSAIFTEMIEATWSSVTVDDMNAQIDAWFHEVMAITWLNNTLWHLADIGLEAQHIYIERPRGTLIITDSLGLKGPSFEDRVYIPYIDMPQHIIVE